MTRSVFTVGHSTRPLREFVELLQQAEVERVVDVRAFPHSRTNPQYNQERLPDSLAPFGIGYMHIPELGGRRGPARPPVPATVNGFWHNASFHQYADYALSDEFRVGLDRLIELGQHQTCAIMCSEAVWWRCHRRIVSDYLIAREVRVLHIMGAGRTTPASLTRGAVIQADGTVHYPMQSPAGDRAL